MGDGRFFNDRERAALYLAADGKCQRCGNDLEPGWHADHVDPASNGGPTDLVNGQALCPRCNLLKGAHVINLRDWQRKAIETFYALRKPDFLVTATPGAGKTKMALSLARRLLDERTVQRVVVVVPTDALRQQWADEATAFGIDLMPVTEAEHYEKAGYQGCVVTYAQIMKGMGSDLLRRATRTPTLAILDEIHHAGESRAWGDGLRYALDQATVRLALTGTPWRRDSTSPIPFVTYDEYGRVVVDHAYEYGAAVADGVCRRIEFHAYDGDAKWIDVTRISEKSLSAAQSEEEVAAVLDAAYSPAYSWMPALLANADAALTDLREEIPDAGGLVVADKQSLAHAYADILRRITGEEPIVAVSDDPDARDAILRFKNGRQRWIVAVRMVSEGVDIPRLGVGVYAAKVRTPLFFRQVVGRFVRTRPGEEFNARMFIPAVGVLMDHAREIEEELRHQLELEAKQAEADARERGDDFQMSFNLRESLAATEASFDRAIMSGDEITPEEFSAAQDYCRANGIPVQYAANVVPAMRARHSAEPSLPTVEVPIEVTPQHRREKMLRQEVETLVRKLAFKTGVPFKQVGADLLREGHPRRKVATIAQLESIERTLLRWLADA